MFVRFVAVSLIGMSLVVFALDWAQYHFRQQPVSIPFAVLWGLLFLAGVVILIKARAVAEWLANKIE